MIYGKINIFLEKIKQKIYCCSLNSKGNKLSNKAIITRNNIFEGSNSVGANSRVVSSKIGYGSYIGERCDIWFSKIGKFCSIANDVSIIGGTHPTSKFVSTHPVFYSLSYNNEWKLSYIQKQKFNEFKFADENTQRLVIIGNDCWIGAGVKILEGIKIGDGAVIGAGAIVTKSVPPYSVNIGVPSKVIKYRFSKETVDSLLKIQWWNRPLEWISENSDLFDDIDKFILEVQNEH